MKKICLSIPIAPYFTHFCSGMDGLPLTALSLFLFVVFLSFCGSDWPSTGFTCRHRSQWVKRHPLYYTSAITGYVAFTWSHRWRTLNFPNFSPTKNHIHYWQNLTARHISISFGLPIPPQAVRDLCFWCLSRLIKTLSFARYECKLINLWKFQLNLVAVILPVTQNNFFILITHLLENVLAFWKEFTNPSLLRVKEWKSFILVHVISLNLWATVCITKTCYLYHKIIGFYQLVW